MDGRRGGGGRWHRSGSGRGRGRGSEGGGRWSPRSPAFFFRPKPQPPPVLAGDGDGVYGSGSNEEGTRKTCSEDDTSSSRLVGTGYSAVNVMPVPPESEVSSSSSHQEAADSFDICLVTRQAASVVLKPPLLLTNRERRNQQIKSTQSPSPSPSPLVTRPGMLLLKAHLSLSDQVKIVKRCRELGMGPGGFYQPGYGEGTKLHLKMMCLGKHWDPQSGHYTDRRPSDGANPPHIPSEFHQLVRRAIESFSHKHEKKEEEIILPPMSPDICIVNFYSPNGRLGLHQDKDESPQSLRQGLPVVSFSIGDSADFLFGDDRDDAKAQKLLLESGDVLIFGGDSRNLFHGVSAIHPMTAPTLLLQQTNLRPGRLNLTFRQY